MISIPVDSTDVFQDKEMNKETTAFGIKLGVWIIGGLLGVSGILIGVIYQDIIGRLLSIDTTISSISISQKTQGELLARLDERSKLVGDRITSLEDRTKTLELAPYKAKAMAAGFKNPEIIETKLQANATFESKTLADNNRERYFIRYTIISYNRSTKELTIGLDAQIGGMHFDHDTLIFKAEAGQIQDVTAVVGKGLPRIFLQIMDLPSPDYAILAIGPKPYSPNKNS